MQRRKHTERHTQRDFEGYLVSLRDWRKEVWAELAAKPNEREKGLMNRDSLPDEKECFLSSKSPALKGFG